MTTKDRAAIAAARIVAAVADEDDEDEIAAIIRGAYVNETVMESRAEHLESVLARVRELCANGLTYGATYAFIERLWPILDSAEQA